MAFKHTLIQKPHLVVALDVGSTYSGYAWQWRSEYTNNRSNVEINSNWSAGAPQLHKTNTAVLLKINMDRETKKDVVETVAFGYEARRRYGNIYKQHATEEGGGQEDISLYYLFEKFKLLLYTFKTEGDFKTHIEDQKGRQYDYKTVMACFIGALRDHFIKHKGANVDMGKILWVLTVPAIWSDSARAFMYEAAKQARIAEKQILLASEPECAAIFSMYLPSEQTTGMNQFDAPGHKFLTVDLGGGTADLFAAEVLTDGTLKELHADRGVMVGGENINEAFLQGILEGFEGQAIRTLISQAQPLEMMQLRQDFENAKVTIGSGNDYDEYIEVSLPKSIRKMIKFGELKLSDEGKNKGMRVQDGKLTFQTKYIRENLFEVSCSRAFQCIKEVLDQDLGLQTVVLVGGFAESEIVQSYIKTKMEEKHPSVKVFIPTSPFQAVLKGAVLFGQDTTIFHSRILRKTFGIETNRVFVEGKHDPERKWHNDDNNKDYCKEVLNIHVRKGQSVVLHAKQPTQTYYPLSKSQTALLLSLYEYSGHPPGQDRVVYTTDDQCKEIGQVRVQIPESTKASDRAVEVTFIYGGTMLVVLALDKKTREEVKAELKFTDI